jgi:hypothetical protein
MPLRTFGVDIDRFYDSVNSEYGRVSKFQEDFTANNPGINSARWARIYMRNYSKWTLNFADSYIEHGDESVKPTLNSSPYTSEIVTVSNGLWTGAGASYVFRVASADGPIQNSLCIYYGVPYDGTNFLGLGVYENKDARNAK